MTTPATTGGALRAVLTAALPDVPVYRGTAKPGVTLPVIVVHDGLNVTTRQLAPGDFWLREMLQVDLYVDGVADTALPDAVHVAIHGAQLTLPGSIIDSVTVDSRYTDTTEDQGGQTTRVIYTVYVNRRLTTG